MPQGARRRGQPRQTVSEASNSESVARPSSGTPTHKACPTCTAINAMQALACQTCGGRFSSPSRLPGVPRLPRVPFRTRRSSARDDDDDRADTDANAVVDLDSAVADPLLDDLVSRMSEAILLNEAR